MLFLMPESWVVDGVSLSPNVRVILSTLLTNAIGEDITPEYEWRRLMKPTAFAYNGAVIDINLKNIGHNQLVVIAHVSESDGVIKDVMRQLEFDKIREAKIKIFNRTDKTVPDEDWYCGIKYTGYYTAIGALEKLAVSEKDFIKH